MKEIVEINGLSVERIDGQRVVFYNGQKCPLIKREEELCQENTSYNGEVLWSIETYNTPIGVVAREYRSWGAGLEHSNTSWRLIPVDEILQAQRDFIAASIQMDNAKKRLESLTAHKE